MIHLLRAHKIIKRYAWAEGMNEDKFAEIIVRLSTCCALQRKSRRWISIHCWRLKAGDSGGCAHSDREWG